MSKQETLKDSRGVLPLVLAALALVVAAVPALNVALPDVAADTGATQSQLQWIVDSYALVFAGLLLPAGALGDRYGRKPLLILGLLVFGGGSAVAALCATPGPLIAARAVMGIGAAMVMPTTLSVITSSFPVQQRAKAVGAWVGVAGAGAILGLITSGLMLERLGWESVFWLNVVLATGVAVVAAKRVPDSRDAHRPSVDVLGGLLLTVALSSVVFAAIEGPELGWVDPLTVGALAGGVAAAALWLVWSLRTPTRCSTRGCSCTGPSAPACLSIGAQFFVFFGFVFLVIQYVQMVLGYSPLQRRPRAAADGHGARRSVPARPAPGRPAQPAPDECGWRAAHRRWAAGARRARQRLVLLDAARRDRPARCGDGARDRSGHHRHRQRAPRVQAGCRVGRQRRGA